MSGMVIPTYLVVPPLLVAFGMLAYLHWRSRLRSNLLDLRFLMMVGAVLLMFTQILLSDLFPMVSLACFALALVWLTVAALLLRRQMTQG
ncbi:MAG: hypothetical protein ACREFY_09980 [Acetobacteraceae bacterium]